jgi:FAD-dependent urate hydroxylase
MTHTIIIGGGIAGPVAAMALDRVGITATVYERHDQPADGVGGLIGLAPNGLAALATVGLAEPVEAISLPVRSMAMFAGNGRKLAEFGGDPAFHAVWRSELYGVLEREARARGVAFEYGRRLEGVTQDDNGVTAHFADGTTATGDILVGADGIRSTVRTLIDPAAPRPRYTGLVSFGGRPTVPLRVPSTHGSFHMFYGKKAVFAYYADDGNTGWYVNMPSPQPIAARDVDAVEWLRRLSALFTGDTSPATEIIRASDPAELVIAGAVDDLPDVPRWSDGRVVIIGDAAHATSPSSGQGGSMAIESGIQLARCLRDFPSVSAAFRGYELLRRERVRRVIEHGRRTDTTKAPGPITRAILPVVMKLLVRPGKYTWMADYRIDFDAPVAGAPARA